MRQSWSKKIIIKTIRRLRRTKEKLNSNHIQIYRPALYSAANNYFGAWRKAIKAAGFSYKRIRARTPYRSWNKKVVVRAIRSRKRRGLPINALAINKQDGALYQAIQRHFVGKRPWRKAVRLSGFDPKKQDPRRFWTKEKVLKEILLRWRSGLPLYVSYLNSRGYTYLVSEGRLFFGSWKKTIKAAGLDYNQIRAKRRDWWNKKRVLKEIRRLAGKGIQLNTQFVLYFYGDIFGAARRYFGSWSQAVEAAGINFREHSKNWSYKAWLQNLTPAKVKKLEQQAIKFSRERSNILIKSKRKN